MNLVDIMDNIERSKKLAADLAVEHFKVNLLKAVNQSDNREAMQFVINFMDSEEKLKEN